MWRRNAGQQRLEIAIRAARQTELRGKKENFVTGTALHFTLRRMRDLFRRPVTLVTMIAVVIALGVSGPFGTYERFAIGPRFAYWAVVVFATFSAGYFCGTLATRLLAPNSDYYVFVPVAGVSSGIAATLVVLAVNALAYPGYVTGVGEAGVLALSCIAISTGIAAVFATFRTSFRSEPSRRTPRLLTRLPVTERGELVSLSVSDHYVEVVTTKGKTLLLMRLSDAIAETEGAAGVQIHRSHWVALDRVARVRRGGGRVTVETSAGDRLPVSRGFLSAVRNAGLIV